MEFYEKLQKLRKEHGMSQEELAAQLGVSRQAVSKWENGQGYPETEKLLLIGNLYQVSMDYLLKDRPELEEEAPGTAGYYASREMVEGFLTHRNKSMKRIVAGVSIIILSCISFFLLPEEWNAVVFLCFVALGVAILVVGGFSANPYKQLEEQPLVFDPTFLSEIKLRHTIARKKMGILITFGILLIFAGVISVIVGDNVMHLAEPVYMTVFFLFVTGGVACIIAGSSVLGAYDLIADNPGHIKEQEHDRRYGWVWALLMPLAAMVFLLLGFTANLWHPGWLVFPVAAIVGAGITGALEAGDKKR